MKYPTTKLEACFYTQLPTYTPVFNLSTIEYFTWIHLPISCIERCGSLFEVAEVNSSSDATAIDMTREGNKPWLKVRSSTLNLAPGQHIYKLSFVDVHTDDVFSLYISYIIQDDNPERPYIYMRRDDADTSCSDCMCNKYETIM